VTKPFISYAREDRDVAIRMYGDLRRAGAEPWLDALELMGGENWEFAIKRALRDSTHCVALISHNSVNKKGYVQKELREALSILEEFPPGAVFLIPVRVDHSQPTHEKLRELHWIDLFPDYADGMQQLLRSLGLPVGKGGQSTHRVGSTSLPDDHVLADVPPQVMHRVLASAADVFPDDLASRQNEISLQITAWTDLQRFEPEMVPKVILDPILVRVAELYGDDFPTRLYHARRQVDAWRELYRLRDDHRVHAVIRVASQKYPDDYVARLNYVKHKLE
jgi:TIR domain